MAQPYACERCPKMFATKEDSTRHRDCFHAIIKFKLNNVETVYSPEETGGYICHCGHHLVAPKFDCYQELVKHLGLLRLHEGKDFGQQKLLFLSRDVAETPLLSLLNFVVNLRHELMICLSCTSAIEPDSVQKHLRKCQKMEVQGAKAKTLEKLMKTLNLLDDMPKFKETTHPMIEGLPVSPGFQCDLCPATYLTVQTVKTHRTAKHPGATTTPAEWPTVNAQRLQSYRNSSHFAVTVPEAPAGEDRALDHLVKVLEAQSQPQKPEIWDKDPRNVAPFLRSVRWHELVENMEVEEVRKLVAAPKGEEFPRLANIVKGLLSMGCSYTEKTSELILQLLNTEDKHRTNGRTINHDPFHPMQNGDATLESYTHPIIGLLAMLLRGCPIQLPELVTDRVEDLRESMAKDKYKDSTAALVCLKLLITVWCHPWRPQIEQRISDPTILFLALSSLNADGSFKGCHLITNVIARFKYGLRSISLLDMHESYTTPEEGWEALKRWFREDEECTFRSLCTAQHIASSITYSTMSMPTVWWVDVVGYRSLLYKGTLVHLEQISELIRNLEAMLVRAFEERILLNQDLSAQYGLLADDMTNETNGYSFYKDERNTVFSDNRTALLHKIFEDDALKNRFVVEVVPGVKKIRFAACREWLADYAGFHNLLLAYIHLTSGAPPRGTEITSALLTNVPLYPRRNIYACGPYIVLMSTYLKTSSQTRSDKLIPHALSAFAADLLVQDLAFARPFAQMAARSVYISQPEVYQRYDTHIFINHMKLFTTENITVRLRTLSAPTMDLELNISSWRHIFSAFRRKHCSPPPQPDEEERNAVEEAGALQMGHNLSTDENRYAVSFDSMSGASEDAIAVYVKFSIQWQAVVRVRKGGSKGRYSLLRMSEGPASESDTKPLVQHLTVRERLDLQDEKLDAILMLLQKERPQKAPPLPSPLDGHSKVISSPRMRFKSPLACLQHLLRRPEAQWRSEKQQEAVELALNPSQDLIVMLRTGFGKSMVALIPPAMEYGKTTVLVLPLRVLITDFVQKLKKMGLEYEVFDSEEAGLLGNTNLIIVSADVVKWQSWNAAIAKVNQTRPVARYVLDEAHIFLLSEDFREALRNMSDIRCNIRCQVILLTATAQERMIQVLRHKFCISPSAPVVSCPSNRPELKYVWRMKLESTKVVDMIKVEMTMLLANPEDRAIVFVNNIAYGNELAALLNCRAYNGKQDKETQEETFSRWVRGLDVLCVATNAFGTGNDYSHVRLVVHVNAPFEAIFYIQEVSRAGRDGQKAVCLLLSTSHAIRKTAELKGHDPQDLAGKQFMLDCQHSYPSCIRFNITSFIDGTGTSCSEGSGNEICSGCLQRKGMSVIV
ncbi:hypothetical protein CPB83DRAFT_899020 [Crepidotus variabilis]|uniref:DNA 3'-5' helicase n=1 Tax=Crepidotus variabilis TaxID=179855 RepID=A0A9P6JJV6_9AGAR|nr:hypothetical protein CPB83DRAFT_899020 [Crepidotus variabilis]